MHIEGRIGIHGASRVYFVLAQALNLVLITFASFFMAHTILVIDDTASMRMMLIDYLSTEGYRVVTATNGREALFIARQHQPDLILLDIMMPEMGGYDFLRMYRKDHATPVILLTAKLEEMDKVVGLELGADDYMTKPFGLRELVARIRAVMRRTHQEAPQDPILRVADVLLDRSRFEVRVGEISVRLTRSEFELLAILMAHPGRVFERSHLLQKMQGFSYEGVERTVDVHVRNLRTKLEPNPRKPKYIHTVYGVGYRFGVG